MNALAPALEHATAVHEALLAAVRDRHAADRRCALLLAEVVRDRLYAQLGYASITAYADKALGIPTKRTRALLQLGRTLPSLPTLDAAFAEGRVSWTKARELLRVVTPETAAAWVERAAAVSSRELEAQVTASHVGSLPPAEPVVEKGPARVRLVFEVEASDAQVIRDAIALARSQAGVHRAEVEDGVLLAAIAQRSLAASPPEAAPSGERYRVVLEQCPTCTACSGREHEASETVALEAECDAEVVDGRPGPGRGRLTRTIPPTVRRAVLHRDRERCRVPGCRCTLFVDVHHVKPRWLGGRHVTGNLVTLCTAHHRQVHAGLLAIEGDADGALTFERAAGGVSVSRPTWGADAASSSWPSLATAGRKVRHAACRPPGAHVAAAPPAAARLRTG
jgi:hypothetical protein